MAVFDRFRDLVDVIRFSNNGPEAKVRRRHIDPMLAARGWQDVAREVHIPGINGKRYRDDYELYLPDNIDGQPVALFEAKHNFASLNDALNQVKDYAVQKQANIRFVFAGNGKHFIQYDRQTDQRSELLPLDQFPTPSDLRTLLSQNPFHDPPIIQNTLIQSMPRIDPNSESEAKCVIEQILPINGRDETLRFFAETIRCANDRGVGKWNVTLPQNNCYIRLNVGRLEICALFSGRCHIVLDSDTLDNRRMLRRYARMGKRGVYTAIPSSMICEFDYKHLSDVKPLMWESYTSLVAKAAATVRRRTSYYVYHSPGVIDYLRHTIDPDLPSPIYE